jgi:hypothetical protein
MNDLCILPSSPNPKVYPLPIHLICSFFCQLPSYIQFRYLNVTPTNVDPSVILEGEDYALKVRMCFDFVVTGGMIMHLLEEKYPLR